MKNPQGWSIASLVLAMFTPTSTRNLEEMLPATVAVSHMDMSMSSIDTSMSPQQKRSNARSRPTSANKYSSRPRSFSESNKSGVSRWQTQQPREADSSSLSQPRRKQSNPNLVGMEDDQEAAPWASNTPHAIQSHCFRGLKRFVSDLDCSCGCHDKDLAPHRISLESASGLLSPRLPLRSRSSNGNPFEFDAAQFRLDGVPLMPSMERRHTGEAPSIPERKESVPDLDFDMSDSCECQLASEV